MPSIYQLKPAFQNLLRPFVQLLYKSGITANQVTLLAMLISTCLGYFLYQHYLAHPISGLLLLFPLWMLIRMAFNAIDGMLAREFKQHQHFERLRQYFPQKWRIAVQYVVRKFECL
jgi:CDP-diacylglycerol---glycerol-3-phosphate 3-phosphatidyltransferase